jgi:hypothetical protein
MEQIKTCSAVQQTSKKPSKEIVTSAINFAAALITKVYL